MVELAAPARIGSPWLRELLRDGAVEVEGRVVFNGD